MSRTKVSKAEYANALGTEPRRKRESPAEGWSAWGIGIARIIEINNQDFTVTLRILQGDANDIQREPVSLTWPGGGQRSFLGVMPEVGEYCTVGWMGQESGGGSKTPIILGKIIPGPWMGRQWLVAQEVGPEEFDLDSLAVRDRFAGSYMRIRQKLKHLEPGNGLMSSAQGSDLMLTESVSLANRRGNEITLRDQDQAFLVRSLSSHIHTSGARQDQGVVHREARILPTHLVSDGKDWAPYGLTTEDGTVKSPDGIDSNVAAAGSDPSVTAEGTLQPHGIFQGSGLTIPGSLDPYRFLESGGLIDAQGNVLVDLPNAVYGGRPLFRVSSGAEPLNAMVNQVPSLVEHRVEVHHTSDGTLPVNSMLDGYEAEASPGYVEQVLGTVVGNDPYGESSTYGHPLKVSTRGVYSAVGTPLRDHAASLFRIRPPVETGATDPTWVSFQKDGAVRIRLGGHKQTQFSLEGILTRGLELEVQGETSLKLNTTRIRTSGLTLRGQGTVDLQGDTTRLAGRNSLVLESKGTMDFRGHQHSQTFHSIDQLSTGSILLTAGDKIAHSSSLYDQSVSGRAHYLFGGPQQGNPVNGPARITQVTTSAGTGGSPGYVVDRLVVPMGYREEIFTTGGSRTTVVTGDLQYSTETGKVQQSAGSNAEVLDSVLGKSSTIQTGSSTVEVPNGAMMISASVEFSAKTTGVATLEGSASVILRGPGGKKGGIVSGADLDPISGLPLSVLGLGSLGHRLD